MIYLQLSTGQSPAECQFFAKHVFHKICREAAQHDLSTEIISETPSKYGLLSAVLAVSGSRADEFAARWLGTLQWICPSPFRPQHLRKNWFVAVSRLPEMPTLPENDEIRFETCRAGGKGGQHVNKTESAVRAVHLSTGLSVRVESERSQHANKKRARELLAFKLAEHLSLQNQDYAQHQHSQLYQLERGNAVRVFRGKNFVE
ncbi:peptide chain release factor H [Alysiella filiformis]|uniref:Peptide chain release factor n=1 Tax=Alysiella filiformis DSM 16848 TaxID=1120981 RepID=A0A286EGT0_9NEIS|nr:peptide chain release factor H [Alysiella filiformis]QMT31788.1 peptide chain release factor H [Alysiella filiformis]UBQ55198.1 peptide chain release factor H [Alysiella filiformis DSM 16848]SOD70029.1 peptide chain release factor [Alysiella filiformis DSM 16848]